MHRRHLCYSSAITKAAPPPDHTRSEPPVSIITRYRRRRTQHTRHYRRAETQLTQLSRHCCGDCGARPDGSPQGKQRRPARESRYLPDSSASIAVSSLRGVPRRYPPPPSGPPSRWSEVGLYCYIESIYTLHILAIAWAATRLHYREGSG